MIQLTLTLKMATTQVVKMSVTEQQSYSGLVHSLDDRVFLFTVQCK